MAMAHDYRVVARHDRFQGPVFQVRSDEVTMPDGGSRIRDYVIHLGVVAVVAVDDQDRVLLVRQYRHPVGLRMWELPAGLMDDSAEPAEVAIARELGEETGLRAARFDHILDIHTSPGYSDELVRLFAAHDLSPLPDGQSYTRHEEEAEMVHEWVDMAEARRMVFRGEITNAICQIGILAVSHHLAN